ncbi:hypothetical protein EDD11_002332 [Mortierella claussenii]|nr:hypothetical protein EDD11_002332 [Mortierella claussenii]
MSSTTASLWESFRADPSSEDLYLTDAHIVFLPTGAGAATEKYIREFYRSGGFSHPKKLTVEERVIHRTVGESSAVDEVEVTVKFVSGAGGWLLPGIEPHHLEDLTITFPMVVCASFSEERIASVRYVWDNASVLKMVKLIGSRHSWPIVAETQIEALRDPTRFRLNPFGNATAAAGSRPRTGISQIFSSPPVSPPPRTTASVAQQQPKKGHPALTSTVFSHLKDNNDGVGHHHPHNSNQSSLSPTMSDEAISPPPSARKGHPALTSTLFNHLKETDPKQAYDDEQNINSGSSNGSRDRTLSSGNGDGEVTMAAPIAKKGHPALTSTVFNHLKEPQAASNRSMRSDQQQQQQQLQQQLLQEEEERGAGWRADYIKPKGHPALTSTIFSQAPVPSSRQQQEQQPEQASREEHVAERGAGWRSDYVKPKGHPALTSTIFSQKPQTSGTNMVAPRPYKKTSHNIFGPPPPPQGQSSTESVSPQQEEYTLEPSTIDAELERHEQRQTELRAEAEAREEKAEADRNASELEDLERQIREQEELNAQAEAEAAAQTDQEQEELEKKVIEEQARLNVKTPPPTVAGAPLSPLSPAQSAKRVHPNYRTSFTIGGPR